MLKLVKPRPDFLDRVGRTEERIRKLEAGVHHKRGERGHYGRLSGWMKMTPIPPNDYTDEDEPARREIVSDVVHVVCPGLDVTGPGRLFTLGPSARPSYTMRLVGDVGASAAFIEVRVLGDIVLMDDLTGSLTFDIRYPLG